MNGGSDKKRDFLLQQNVTRGLGEDRIGDTPETPPQKGVILRTLHGENDFTW